MNNQLVVQGQKLELPAVPSVRQFVASKAGITLPALVKGTPGPTLKEVKELCKAAGATDEQLKAWSKEFDGVRKQHYVQSGMAIAMLAADPAIRKSARLAKNAKGEVIGVNATFRKERSASVSGAVRIAQLEAQLAGALARLAALPVA